MDSRSPYLVPFHSGDCWRSRQMSATSPRRITVQAITPAIFLPAPARPNTVPRMTLSRLSIWLWLAAERSFWMSSRNTKSGRSSLPSCVVRFMPLNRELMPAVTSIEPDDGLPSMVGKTMVPLLPHDMSVGLPWYRWPVARWTMPCSLAIGKQTSGKSAMSRSLLSISVWTVSSIS